MLFGKPLSVNVPDNIYQYLENIDGQGNGLDQFVNDTIWDCSQTGYGAILVDAPIAEGLSKKEAEENNLFPYMTYYRAEDIINSQFDIVGRRQVLVRCVLREIIEQQTVDKYTREEEVRYRVLELDENGYYKVTLCDEYEVPISENYPRKYGELMRYIPIYFLPNTKPYKSMFKNLVDVNLSWYRKSADLEHGAHWTATPTPYALGYQPEIRYNEKGEPIAEKKLHLGARQFVMFPPSVTGVGFLEFSGSGLSILQSMMDADEERMAILGARIISQEKKGVESAETARIHRASENSVLANFALECSRVITRVVKDYLEWTVGQEITDEIDVQINRDYETSRMNPQELTTLVALWQSGGISKRILFNNIKEGEIIKGDLSFDEMESEIQEEKGNNIIIATEE